jgi:hypothetical protein
MKPYFLFLCLIIIVFSRCASSQKAQDAKENALFDQWLHKPKALLVQNWGQPDSTISDGKRGQILIYKEGVDYKSIMNEKYTGKQFSFRKEMYVNSDSLIYYWKAWRKK